MPLVSNYPLNTFSFPGFCSGDAKACSQFYAAVLGWTPELNHTPDGDFTAFKVDGEVVAGMYQMPDARKAAGVVPHWNSYLIVGDVNETVKKAESLGGKVLGAPFEAMGDYMANLQDPEGAKFSVWESRKQHADPTLLNELGTLCWSELYARNPESEAKFYTELLGWQQQPFSDAPMPYTVFNQPTGEPAWAGMAQICDEMEDTSSRWMPYFMVEDVDKTIELAREAGGKAHGPMDVPNAGRIAFITDSEGATFGIIKPSMP